MHGRGPFNPAKCLQGIRQEAQQKGAPLESMVWQQLPQLQVVIARDSDPLAAKEPAQEV